MGEVREEGEGGEGGEGGSAEDKVERMGLTPDWIIVSCAGGHALLAEWPTGLRLPACLPGSLAGPC